MSADDLISTVRKIFPIEYADTTNHTVVGGLLTSSPKRDADNSRNSSSANATTANSSTSTSTSTSKNKNNDKSKSALAGFELTIGTTTENFCRWELTL
jgi:hypothetical protein